LVVHGFHYFIGDDMPRRQKRDRKVGDNYLERKMDKFVFENNTSEESYTYVPQWDSSLLLLLLILLLKQ
jgi:hypothetical protein